jgi:hypothetical protein
MLTNQDGVTVAFDVIREELEAAANGVNIQGADFLKSGQYDEATILIESGRKMLAFRNKIEALKEEWLNGHDATTRSRVQIENVRSITSHNKAPKTGLSVTFPDGTEIHHQVAAETFAATLNKLGLERVRSLNKKVNGFPLVSNERSDKYDQVKSDTLLVMTHSNTESKKRMLEEIAKELAVLLKVQIVK